MHGGRELVYEPPETELRTGDIESDRAIIGSNRMSSNRVQGARKELAGRVKRQAAEWSGNTAAQFEGLVQEGAGMIQKAWGQSTDEAGTDSSRRGMEKHGTEPARLQPASTEGKTAPRRTRRS
jgi:uncharacterized protein YjbJ (UPF0337 family)